MEVCRPFLNILTLVQTQKMAFSIPIFRPGALFLESPGIFSGPKSGVVFAVFVFKITLSKIFEKLSANEEKLTGFWARTGADYCPAARNCATIQQVWISKFAFGAEKFLGLSRKGPVVSKK